MKIGTFAVILVMGFTFAQAVVARPAPRISIDKLQDIWNPAECSKSTGDLIYCYEIINALVEGASPREDEIFAMIPTSMLNEKDFEILIGPDGLPLYKNEVIVAVKMTDNYIRNTSLLLYTDQRELWKRDNAFKARFRMFVMDPTQNAKKLKFDKIQDTIVKRFMNNANKVSMITAAITKQLRLEGDPYASLVSDLDFDKSAMSYGMSINAFFHNGKMRLVQVLPYQTLDKLGLSVGDELVSIDGIPALPENMIDFSKRVERNKGKKDIVYKFKTAGSDKDIEFKAKVAIKPSKLVETYKYSVGEKNVGVVLINTLEHNKVCESVKFELKKLLGGSGVKALILDVRNNDGGLLKQMDCVAGLFLGAQQEIYREVLLEEGLLYNKLKGTSSPIFIGKTPAAPQIVPSELPVVTLVNGGSASAAELFALVMRTQSRSWIVGQRTYGKGIVQDSFDYQDGQGLELWVTSNRHEVANGFSVHLKGLTPDFVMNSPLEGLDGEKLVTRFIDEQGPAFVSETPAEELSVTHKSEKLEIEKCIPTALADKKINVETSRWLKDQQLRRATEVALCIPSKSE